MVSSPIPYVVPPRANNGISTKINIFSRPLYFFTMEAIPVSSIPVSLTTPRKPPTIKMKKATSIAALVSLINEPFSGVVPSMARIGAINTSQIP